MEQCVTVVVIVHDMSVVLLIYSCALLFISSTYKYFFIVERSSGTTIFHPMLPYPTVDEDDDPIIMSIRILEKDAEAEGIISSMLRFDESKNLLGPILFNMYNVFRNSLFSRHYLRL